MKRQAVIAGIFLTVLSLFFHSAGAADCTDVWVDVQDEIMPGNSTDYFYFPVYNDSEEGFEVYEVIASKEYGSDPFTVTAADYPNEIDSDDWGEITLRVETEGVDTDESYDAYIRIRGAFEDDTYCGFNDIGKQWFSIDIETGENGEEDECQDIALYAEDITIDEGKRGRYSFTIENSADRDFTLHDIEVDEDSSYFDAVLYSKPGKINQGSSRDFRVKISANRVSRNRSGEVVLRAKGKFEGRSYCNYDEIDEEQFTVYVEDTGAVDDEDDDDDWEEEEECPGISLNDRVVRVAKGETAYTTFFLENHSSENFLIDYVSVFDNSRNFVAEENGYGKIVKPGDDAFVNVRVRAYSEAVPGRENAFVAVKGHFQNQESCYLSGTGLNAFPVVIEEKAVGKFQDAGQPGTAACSSFSLVAPSSQSIGEKGSIPITIDNRTNARAEVRLQGPGLTVSPALVSVPKHTQVRENVSVSSKLQKTSLVYSIEALGCKTERVTEISSAQGQQEGEEPGQAEQAIQGIVDAMATGFTVLGENAVALGLAIVVVLLLYLAVKR